MQPSSFLLRTVGMRRSPNTVEGSLPSPNNSARRVAFPCGKGAALPLETVEQQPVFRVGHERCGRQNQPEAT